MKMKHGLMALSTALIMLQTTYVKAQEKASRENIKPDVSKDMIQNLGIDTTDLYYSKALYQDGEPYEYNGNNDSHRNTQPYLVSGEKIYYRDDSKRVSMSEVDKDSFLYLGHYRPSEYARDKNAIYYADKRLVVEGLDSKTFEHYKNNYWKDNKKFYYVDGENIVPLVGSNTSVEAETLRREKHISHNSLLQYAKKVTYEYLINNGTVYLWGKPIQGADANSFESLDGGYAKDSTNAFYDYDIIPGADGPSFRVKSSEMYDYYGEDKNNIFIRSKPPIYFGSDEDQE